MQKRTLIYREENNNINQYEESNKSNFVVNRVGVNNSLNATYPNSVYQVNRARPYHQVMPAKERQENSKVPTDPATGRKSTYLSGFDGLRALALIFVLLYHWFPQTIKGGYLGVVIFFTLSGYLVTDKLLSEYQTRGQLSVVNFYKKRLSKLYPPLIFFLLALSTWIFIFQRNTLYNYRSGFLSSLLGYNNIWQILSQASYFEQFTQINFFTHIWTLAVELQFYLIWPFLISLLGMLVPTNKLRSSFRFFGLVLTGVSAIWMSILAFSGASINRIYFGTDTRAFSIFLGATLAAFISSKRIKQITQIFSVNFLNILTLIVGLPMLALLFTLSGEGGFVYYGGMLFFNILLIIMMPIIATKETVIGKLMHSSLGSTLTKRSYSIYLWQYPIMVLSNVSLRGLDIPYAASFFFQVIALLIISEISYQLTEKKSFDKTILFTFLSYGNKSSFKKVLSFLLTFLLGAGTVLAFIVAPSDLPDDIKELQNRLAENKKQNINLQDIKTEEELKNKELENQASNKPSISEKEENITNKNDNQQNGASNSLEPRTFTNKNYVAALDKHLPVKLDKVGASKDFEFAVSEVPDLALTEIEKHLATVLPAAIIGDSVLLGSKPEVLKILPNTFVDGEVSRQFAAGANIVDQLASVKKLPKTIVLALGTNGVISAEEVNNFASKYKDHTIFLVNTVVNNDSEKIANTAIADVLVRQPNTVLIDWHSLAKTKVGWFASDNVHPSVDGRSIYAQLIAKRVLSYYVSKAEEKLKLPTN